MNKSESIFTLLWNANPVTRRTILILIDSSLIIFSITLSSILGKLSDLGFDYLWLYLLTFFISLPLYILTKQYKTLSRYSEALTFYQILIRNAFLYFLVYIFGYLIKITLPNLSLIILIGLITSLSQIFLRLTIRDFVNYSLSLPKKKKLKVAIYGAGENGALLAKSLKGLNTHKIQCFFDDDKKLWGRLISGISIKSPEYLNEIKEDLDQVLLAIPTISLVKRKKIIDSLQKFRVPLLTIPSVEQLVSGKAKIETLRPISINELLGRDVVTADHNLLQKGVENKVILITGAGGSIGSELCKQIYNLNPKKLILFEFNESNLYSINSQLQNLKRKFSIIPILGDACNFKLLEKILLENSVEVVFHAAAYKHVPLVEINPIEGLRNNIISTLNICKASESTNVKNVVFISSDKAVRPTNIMGTSKRLSELIIQAYSQKQQELAKDSSNLPLIFSMVRFGNVLDSSGSVVPLFREQIAKGGPITLTHENVIRYFMTIPEASQLVLQSLPLAQGGDLFLLDMGEPVLIKKLAEQMVSLSGKSIKNLNNPDGDIEIVVTGLRPGEKLYEELLIDAESLPTSHPLIFKANEKSIDHKTLFMEIERLVEYLNSQNKIESISIIKKIVPEWEPAINY